MLALITMIQYNCLTSCNAEAHNEVYNWKRSQPSMRYLHFHFVNVLDAKSKADLLLTPLQSLLEFYWLFNCRFDTEIVKDNIILTFVVPLAYTLWMHPQDIKSKILNPNPLITELREGSQTIETVIICPRNKMADSIKQQFPSRWRSNSNEIWEVEIISVGVSGCSWIMSPFSSWSFASIGLILMTIPQIEALEQPSINEALSGKIIPLLVRLNYCNWLWLSM